MSKNWAKMTEDEKKAYYAARKSRRAKNAAVKARAVRAAKAGEVAQAPSARNAKVSPEESLLNEIFGSENELDALMKPRANESYDEALARESLLLSRMNNRAVIEAVQVIGKALLKLARHFRPDVRELRISIGDSAKKA